MRESQRRQVTPLARRLALGGYRGPPEDRPGRCFPSSRTALAPRRRGQSGTRLVHGRRAAGPPVVALDDLATGEQRWANEGVFEQTEPQKKGLGGLMQRLVTAASEATALEVLQAGPNMIVVHTLMGLRALDARRGAGRWSPALPPPRARNPARPLRLVPSLRQTGRHF